MYPDGITSSTVTPVASDGPSFVTLIVNVMVLPAFGVGLLTVFSNLRSATAVGVVPIVESSSSVVESSPGVESVSSWSDVSTCA